jgi:peroxiredoxin Q/BCP
MVRRRGKISGGSRFGVWFGDDNIHRGHSDNRNIALQAEVQRGLIWARGGVMLAAMKPKVGEMAPDFRATVVDGESESELSLADLRGETVVLVFYPKDNTPGCTIQACSLRDHWDEIKGKARIFGVSADGAASHTKFIAKKRLPYPLIADEDKAIAEAYGVWVQKSMLGKKFMGIERSTFVIAPDGKIAAVLEKVSPLKHTEQLSGILG